MKFVVRSMTVGLLMLLVGACGETSSPPPVEFRIPVEVSDEAVTPEASVAPVSVPAAAVTVMAAVPSKSTPLIALAVASAVAVAALPVVLPELPVHEPVSGPVKPVAVSIPVPAL